MDLEEICARMLIPVGGVASARDLPMVVKRNLTPLLLVFAVIPFLASLAAASPQDPEGLVGVGVEGDQEGDVLAVSVFGNARSNLVAVSGTGTADAQFGCDQFGPYPNQIIGPPIQGPIICDDDLGTALSGTGSAQGEHAAASLAGPADCGTFGNFCIAVSGTGSTSGSGSGIEASGCSGLKIGNTQIPSPHPVCSLP